MAEQKLLRDWDPMEITNLEFEFATRYLEVSRLPRDYGTGAAYTLAEAHGVTFIEEHPGVTATEMADAFGRTRSAASQTVKRLESLGLIIRQSDSRDRKKSRLYVTEKGRELSLAHKAYDIKNTAAFVRWMEKQFSESELDCFYRVLKMRTEGMRAVWGADGSPAHRSGRQPAGERKA